MEHEDKLLYNIAAMLYNSKSNNIKRDSVLRKVVESIIVIHGNKKFSCAELSVEINNKVHMIVVEDEILDIITNSKNRGFALDYLEQGVRVCLRQDRYDYIMNQNEKNMEYYIKEFVSIRGYGSDVQELIERFLYNFYCRNVNDFGSALGTELRMHVEDFETDDVKIIQEFIDWENPEKNDLLLAVANYALEYLLISGNRGLKEKKDLAAVFANKRLYIDTNIIFYCIGINGTVKETSNVTFLRKCKDCGEQIVISYYTQQEFDNTLDHFINEIDRVSSPFCFNKKVISYITSPDVYQYYITWANERRELRDGKYFKQFLLDKYNKLISDLSIEVERKNPFPDEKLQNDDRYQEYRTDVPTKSGTEYDAKNIYYVESRRESYETDLQNANSIFISAHKDLQRWDRDRERITAPVVIDPSLWLVLLARLISRSDDDQKCFISYLNLANRELVITNKEYLEVVKTIDRIVADVKQQESVLAVMVEEEFAFLNNDGEKRTSDFIEERTVQKTHDILEQRVNVLEKNVQKYQTMLESSAKKNKELEDLVNEQALDILEKDQHIRESEQLNEDVRERNYVEYESLKNENSTLKHQLDKRKKINKTIWLSLMVIILDGLVVREFIDIFINKNSNPWTYQLFIMLVNGSVCDYENIIEQYWYILFLVGGAIVVTFTIWSVRKIYGMWVTK